MGRDQAALGHVEIGGGGGISTHGYLRGRQTGVEKRTAARSSLSGADGPRARPPRFDEPAQPGEGLFDRPAVLAGAAEERERLRWRRGGGGRRRGTTEGGGGEGADAACCRREGEEGEGGKGARRGRGAGETEDEGG